MQTLGVNEYEILATLDRRTSDICRSLDGKVFKMSDKKPGVTAPPFHPWCRSCTIPHTKKLKGSKRAARDDGKTYYVPASMKYDDWKSVFVDKTQTLEQWRKNVEKSTASDKTERISALKKMIEETHLANCSVDDVVSIGKEVNSLFEVSKHLGDRDFLKKIFGQFRELDGSQEVEFAKGSFKKNREMLIEAFSCYPKAWAEYLVESGRKIFTKKAERGFFNSGAVMVNGKYYDSSFDNYRDGYVTIHMSGQRATTPFHEIGHMVEFFNKDALRISRAFVKARTKGEKPVKLKDLFPSADYEDIEVTRPDNFIDPYIGKDYGSSASEVLSMGLEQIFSPTKRAKRQIVMKRRGERTTLADYDLASIEDDEEYLALIIGLLLKA